MAGGQIKVEEGTILISTAGACELFDIDRRSLGNWERSGLEKYARGWWVLKDIIRFRGLGGAGGLDGKEQSLAEQKLIAEINLKESQGELSRLKNELMAGKYLESYYVESELKRFFTVFKRSCLNLSRKLGALAASYVDPDVARRLEHESHKTITEALEQLSIGGIIHGKR